MSMQELLPLAVLFSSLVPGLAIFALPESWIGVRTTLNLFGAFAKLGLVFLLLAGVAAGDEFGLRYAVLPGLDLAFKVDALGMLFITLSAILWLFTTLYAIGYLEGAPHRSRFFGFFSLCVTAPWVLPWLPTCSPFSSSMNCSPCRPSRWSPIAGPTRPCAAGPSTWPIRWLAARPC